MIGQSEVDRSMNGEISDELVPKSERWQVSSSRHFLVDESEKGPTFISDRPLYNQMERPIQSTVPDTTADIMKSVSSSIQFFFIHLIYIF